MIMSISKSLYPFDLGDFSLYPYTFFCCSSLPQLFNDFIYYHCCSFIFFCFSTLCKFLPHRKHLTQIRNQVQSQETSNFLLLSGPLFPTINPNYLLTWLV